MREVLADGGTPARAAAELADADLTSLLKEKLVDGGCRLAAVRALARLGVPVADMNGPLPAEFDRGGGHPALAAVRQRRAVGTLPALEEMAASDHRLPTLSTHDGRVGDDERLIEDIRATIAALS
ncbi:hypothetical protein [Actinoplanes sp. NPDC051411]|uniref:hypothetical protein n=1 Tax=Actinoplanes sp. NPDC051411 TaxID=3155522 RepID=UPI0034179D59